FTLRVRAQPRSEPHMTEQSDGGNGRLTADYLDLAKVYRTFALLALVGLAAALLYSITTSITTAGFQWTALAVFGGSLLVAGAVTLVGGLIGSVFAIRRSRQEHGQVRVEPAATNSNRTRAASATTPQTPTWSRFPTG